MSERRREYQGSAFDLHRHLRVLQTRHLICIMRLQRRRLGRLHRRQRDHNHCLRIQKRRGSIQLQIQRRPIRKRQPWNVLILRGLQKAYEVHHIHNRANIRRVQSRAHRCCVRGIVGQARYGSRRQRLRDTHPMSIVHQHRNTRHRQTRHLLVYGLLETIRIRLQRQRLRQLRRTVRNHLRISRIHLLHRRQVSLYPQLLERSLVQRRIRADEQSRPPAHGPAQRLEVPTRLRRNEHQRLLGSLRHGNGCALDNLLVPGIDLVEPVFRRLIRSSAQKRNNQQQVIGLRGRQIHLHPDLVFRHQVRHLSNRQRHASALYTHIHFGPDQIKFRRIIGPQPRTAP